MKRIQAIDFRTKCAAIAVMTGLAMASGLYGQLVTGSILGTILDSVGSPIPNASVSLTSERANLCLHARNCPTTGS